MTPDTCLARQPSANVDSLSPADAPVGRLSRRHWQRLRRVYRSAGWPFLDNIEIDLLAAGLLERVQPDADAHTLRVTDAGVQGLSRWLNRNRRARDAHEHLVERIARHVTDQQRIAYCGLKLRARPADRWLRVCPDVYSIRSTTVVDYLCPVIHEIKVRRSDLLSDLNKPGKRAGYLFLSAQCYYVLAEGIATPEEIPPECGVLVATDQAIEVARPAPGRRTTPDFGTWMALARAAPARPLTDPEPML